MSAEAANTTPVPQDAAVKTEEISTSAAEGRRLYIGNLAYATTEGELKTFFKDFLVEAVSIPTNPRTNRPVGYAFVDLSTPTEAERAIAELNGQIISERKVSIQLARKPEPQGEGEVSGEGGEPNRRGSTRGRGRGRTRGRGSRGAARGGRGARKDNGVNGSEPVDETADVAGQAAAAAAETPGDEATADGKKQSKPRTTTAAAAPVRKQRGPPEDGVPSKTKVMVANLPYDLGEDKLLELFSAYQPSAAKIALRPIPRFMIKKLQARGEPRKGRGFGFVTLATEELQQQACAEMNGKEIEGREIAVKVAIDSPGKEDEPLSPTDDVAGENADPEAVAA